MDRIPAALAEALDGETPSLALRARSAGWTTWLVLVLAVAPPVLLVLREIVRAEDVVSRGFLALWLAVVGLIAGRFVARLWPRSVWLAATPRGLVVAGRGQVRAFPWSAFSGEILVRGRSLRLGLLDASDLRAFAEAGLGPAKPRVAGRDGVVAARTPNSYGFATMEAAPADLGVSFHGVPSTWRVALRLQALARPGSGAGRGAPAPEGLRAWWDGPVDFAVRGVAGAGRPMAWLLAPVSASLAAAFLALAAYFSMGPEGDPLLGSVLVGTFALPLAVAAGTNAAFLLRRRPWTAGVAPGLLRVDGAGASLTPWSLFEPPARPHGTDSVVLLRRPVEPSSMRGVAALTLNGLDDAQAVAAILDARMAEAARKTGLAKA